MSWWLKIALKIVLARLPVSYDTWRRLSLFRHGDMDDPSYALACIRNHLEALQRVGKQDNYTALELGPGDSLASALIMNALGARHCWLVDAGDFANRDMALYRQMAQRLREQGLAVPELPETIDSEGMLTACDAEYLTQGLASLRTMPAGSVDLIWSQAVLEHVRRHEFADNMRELRRIIAADGICSHRVDLRDHLAAALNNLRFSERVWEHDLMARSGFYTNRIGFSEMLDLCRDAGFDVEITHVDRWPSLPTPRASMAAPFRDRADDDLLVSGFNVLLRPN